MSIYTVTLVNEADIVHKECVIHVQAKSADDVFKALKAVHDFDYWFYYYDSAGNPSGKWIQDYESFEIREAQQCKI